MTNEPKTKVGNGYQADVTKGYSPVPSSDSSPYGGVQGGHTPISEGDNPTNVPTPPGDE